MYEQWFLLWHFTFSVLCMSFVVDVQNLKSKENIFCFLLTFCFVDLLDRIFLCNLIDSKLNCTGYLFCGNGDFITYLLLFGCYFQNTLIKLIKHSYSIIHLYLWLGRLKCTWTKCWCGPATMICTCNQSAKHLSMLTH